MDGVTEMRLAEILGGDYGGPALGYEDDTWFIYQWFDAPVCTERLAEGSTLEECVHDYDRRQRR